MEQNSEQNKTIYEGMKVGYLILLLHVLLIIGLGVAVVLLKGIYDFRWLILFGGVALIGGSAYFFYRRMQENNRKLSDIMSDPALKDRTLEISLLGGMATFKLGHRSNDIKIIEAESQDQTRQLEAPKSTQLQDLSELRCMLEQGLITRDEFKKLKNEII